MLESIRRVTGKSIVNKTLRCLTVTKGPIDMIEEKTEMPNAHPTEREARQQWIDAPEHVYFIYSAGRVKIGYSTDWFKRMETICVACPHQAELILVMPGNRKMERGYHALFSDYRETGEWFRLDGDLRRFLDMNASPGRPRDAGVRP